MAANSTPTAAKKSDLGVRTISAIVMLLIAGTALWLGGWLWTALAALLGVGIYFEWCRLVARISTGFLPRFAGFALGALYIGFATLLLSALGNAAIISSTDSFSGQNVLAIIAIVIATDTCAYFAGRTFGGPKIAPKISPSKTWSGLIGGALGAGLVLSGLAYFGLIGILSEAAMPAIFLIGASLAVVAQAGDFLESWMKRRAGMKDSSNLIPGHGGLFDRFDGLIAVCCVVGAILFCTGFGAA